MHVFKQSPLKTGHTGANRLPALAMVLTVTLLAVSCAGTPENGLAAFDEDPDQVCLLLKVTGTNIAKEQCRSKETWEALAERDREVASEYFRQTSQQSSVREQADASPFE